MSAPAAIATIRSGHCIVFGTHKMPATGTTMTTSAEDPDIKRSYELGANSYIVKPVEFNNFSKTVADLGLYWMVINKS